MREVAFKFVADDSDAAKAFDKLGDSAKNMASKVDDSGAAHTRLGEKVGGNEAKFMGTADLLDGLGGAFGLPTEGATQLARGLGDLSGGFEVVSGILPGVSGLFPKLAGAMTFVSAHPLMVAFLVGGAIIAGLIMLEKKFGIVSGAVEGLGGAFSAMWNVAKGAMNFVLGGVEQYLNLLGWGFNNTLGRMPGVPNIPKVNLPRLASGGTVLESGLAVIHKGEEVRPASVTSNFSSGGGDTINVYVAGSISTEGDIVDAVHAGLLRKQGRGGAGSLGFRA
ncbi:MAG: hypothetical protein ACR2M4_02940 [Actinomycetota bacterium]